MDNNWQSFFEKFPETVTCEQLPVKLPRFDLDLCDLAGAAADWCHQYLKDRKCPSDLIVFLTQKIINNLRVQWAAEPQLFGYRPEKNDYQALWLMRRVIGKLNEVCLNHNFDTPYQPILTPVWWSSFVLKNSRRQMEDYIAVVPYLHTLFDIKDHGEASFYAVYDGHNGLDAAVYSSMYLHQYLVQSAHYPTNPEYALYEAFFITDHGFAQKTEKYNLVSGTTAVCALLNQLEKKLYIGWVGDSIAMLWKNGTPLCLVNKHVPDRHDETKRIENEGGMITKCQGIWRVDGQLAVSRAIGDVKYKPHITCQPEIRALVLDGNEEFLVLGSDGLWEFTTPEDVADTIYDELLETDDVCGASPSTSIQDDCRINISEQTPCDGLTPDRNKLEHRSTGDVSGISNKLVFKSKSQGSKDNISVITVFLQDPKQLVTKRRAAIMETAMELQRNATSTLASYGQDAGDFGPETDVDTPDEPIGLTKPKAEGEANVIDESGEDSEEDGGGWNYYNKSATEGVSQEKNTLKTTEEQQNDDNKDINSDAEDMDYKLNPDAPEFVPVSSPPARNHAQRFLNMETDDLISSSPQKYKETIDNVDVPDENDFTNEIKMQSADLSKLDNPLEPIDDSCVLNGIKSFNEEVTTNHNEIIDDFMLKNEQITNGNLNKYTNPFVSDENVDLNKVQDLSEYINDNDHTKTTDAFVSMDLSKNNEFNSTSCDNGLENELNTKLNDDSSMGDHMQYEQDMNLKNVDATNINTTNATDDSTILHDDESFKHSDDFKNEFIDSNNIDKFGQYDDRKLNDSVSTTDAVLGSEPNTPMRMDNQSTFESENDDDQFSESFKQQLKFNQFDENNDKENHDPFCFEQTEDPAGIIPNVTHEVNEVVDETLHNDDDSYVKSNENPNVDQVSELNKHEPVEEPLCIKEKAKPIHLAYEQQYLPESDFSISTHETLLNTPENIVGTEHFEQQRVIESHDGNEVKNEDKLFEQEYYDKESIVPSHVDIIEQDDSDVDDVKEHIGLKQELYHDDKYDLEQESSIANSVHIQDEDMHLEHKYDNDFKQESHTDYVLDNDKNVEHQNHDIESTYNYKDFKQEHNVLSNVEQDYAGDFKQETYDNIPVDISNNVKDYKYEDQFIVEDKPVENIAEVVQSYIENFEQKHDDYVSEVMKNHVEDLEQKHNENVSEVLHNYVEDLEQKHSENVSEVLHNNVEDLKHYDDAEVEQQNYVEHLKENHIDNFEIKKDYVEDFKQEHQDVEEVESKHIDDIKAEHNDVVEIVQNYNGDFQLDHHGVESVENHTTDSDEEMHSSMIIHSDVENNMPQPYCSSHDTLLNESNMMCTSMTFEENFQNRNMSDSLYVMETSSDYFGEEIEQATQLNKSMNETKPDEQLSNVNNDEFVEPIQIENEIISVPTSELKVDEVKTETNDSVEKIKNEEETNKVADIAIAAAIGTAAIAAGVSLNSKKSAPKKIEKIVSKAKTTTTKTTSTKPMPLKPLSPLKKPIKSTTTSKSITRPMTAPSTTSKPTANVRLTTVPSTTSKPTANVRPTIAPKTTTLKTTATTAAKTAPKPAVKTTNPTSRPISKTTPTIPQNSLTKTTSTPPKTPTTPKTTAITKVLSTTPKTSTTPRTSTLISRQSLTNGSSKPLSRPTTAPAKKPLSNGTTNGITKLTNGDLPKTSTTATTKSPITLATRMSLAPPKLPPKVKAVPKTVTPPVMPGPIRRPNAPITKKTETATS